MHINSQKALREITQNGSKESRKELILECLKTHGNKPLRVWDILQFLFPGSDSCNKVAPRIKELQDAGVLEECGSVYGPIGRLKVKTVRIANYDTQLSMF